MRRCRVYTSGRKKKASSIRKKLGTTNQTQVSLRQKKPACSSSGRMMISVCGKYSDLWVVLRQAFPEEKLPVTFFCHRRQIQQRDCSGFTPDSLLGSEHGSSHRRCYAGQRRAIGLRQPPLFCSKIIPQPPARRNRAHGNIFCSENYTIFRKCVIFQ